MPTVITRGAASAFALGFGASAGGESYWSVGSLGTGASANYPNGQNDGIVIVEDADGNVYFIDTGSSVPAPQIIVTKTSPTGTLIWENKYITSYSGSYTQVFASSATFDSSGNLYIAAATSFGAATPFVVLKISSAGAVLAQQGYQRAGGGNAFVGGAIAFSPTGELFATYYDASNNTGVILKLNPSTLAVLYAKQMSGYNPHINSLAFTNDGQYVFIGGYAGFASRIDRFIASDLSYSTGRTFITGLGTQMGTWGLAMDASNNLYAMLGHAAYNVLVKIATNLNSVTWAYQTTVSASTPILGSKANKITVSNSGDVFFTGRYGNPYTLGYSNTYGYFLARMTSSGTMVYSRSIPNDYENNCGAIPDKTGLKAIYMAAGLGSNGPYASQTLYMRMPINGDGTGIYSNSIYYFDYSQGPSFSSLTVTPNTSTVSPSDQSITLVNLTFTSATNTRTRIKTDISSPASNSSATYDVPGTYTFIAPAGVTSVSAICVGGGGGGSSNGSGGGGGGGALAYGNNISVTPLTSYTVNVGIGGVGGIANGAGPGNGGQSSFITVSANGGNPANYSVGGTGGTVGAGSGGAGGRGGDGSAAGGGGGGAGGYSGAGGIGGYGNTSTGPLSGAAGSGGAAGGGAGGFADFSGSNYSNGSNGGGVGILGQGTSGASSTGAGNDGSTSWPYNFGGGGGGGGQYVVYCCCGSYWAYYSGNAGRSGVVRILWGSATRTFPSTNVSVP